MYDNICEWNRRFKWTDNRCTKPCTIQIKSHYAICKVFPTLVMTLKRYVRRGTWRRRFIKMLGGCIFIRIQIFLTKLYLDDTCKFTCIFFYQIWSLLLYFIFRFFSKSFSEIWQNSWSLHYLEKSHAEMFTIEAHEMLFKRLLQSIISSNLKQ